MLLEYAADGIAGEKLVLDVPVEVYYDAKGVKHVISRGEAEEI